LVDRFRTSTEAQVFQEINDLRAQRVLYFAFGVIFFVGVFVVTHAWSLVAVDTVAVHVYPRSAQEYEQQFGGLVGTGGLAQVTDLLTTRLQTFLGTQLQNKTAAMM
jgi:hypothetical protein